MAQPVRGVVDIVESAIFFMTIIMLPISLTKWMSQHFEASSPFLKNPGYTPWFPVHADLEYHPAINFG